MLQMPAYIWFRWTGVCAAIIDIGATWMSDLKEGICVDAFWLNREQCCWAANDTLFDALSCSQVGGLSVLCDFSKHGMHCWWIFLLTVAYLA